METIDKLIALLIMLLIAVIVLYLVLNMLEKEKKEKKLEDKMAKFEVNLKKDTPTNRGQNAIVTLSDIRNLSE